MTKRIYHQDTLDKKNRMIHWCRHMNVTKIEKTQKTIVWLQSPTLARDTLDYTEGANQLNHIAKRERHKIDEDPEVNIDPSGHISDRLHRTA